jgi:hypothetical protein
MITILKDPEIEEQKHVLFISIHLQRTIGSVNFLPRSTHCATALPFPPQLFLNDLASFGLLTDQTEQWSR